MQVTKVDGSKVKYLIFVDGRRTGQSAIRVIIRRPMVSAHNSTAQNMLLFCICILFIYCFTRNFRHSYLALHCHNILVTINFYVCNFVSLLSC